MFLRKESIFVLAVFFVGIIGIFTVYSCHLNGPPIRSDGVGYYLYLPAVFIYHDIGLQRIATERFDGLMPVGSGASPYKNSQKYLIKYPIGEALLMMPFFFLACLASFVANVKIDGFSFLFQYAAAVSGLFYATAGLAILWRVLQRRFRQNTILLVLFGLLFGTNLFHYATYDSVFSHAYSFFLFCAFLCLIDELIRSGYSPGRLITAGAAAGLIIVTRPTNALWLLVGALYGVSSIPKLLKRFRFWMSHAKECLFFLAPFLGIIFLQLLYWKIITGTFIIYPYQNEQFDFLKPEIVNVLFSVRKGLFFWSPILFIALPGLFYVRKRYPELFIPALLFLPLNAYVISSWGCWWYGGAFGHRAFVESVPIFAVCLCSFYEGIGFVWGRRAFVFVTLVCAAFSTWLMAKYWTGAIPFDGVTLSQFIKAISPC